MFPSQEYGYIVSFITQSCMIIGELTVRKVYGDLTVGFLTCIAL